MNADTLTSRIHAQADAELRKKIDESFQWIWDETGHQNQKNPELDDFPKVQASIMNQGRPKFTSMPWIGAVQSVHTEVAFAYLRDKYRSRAVNEFMAKVNGMAAEMENLGIVVQQAQEEEAEQ